MKPSIMLSVLSIVALALALAAGCESAADKQPPATSPAEAPPAATGPAAEAPKEEPPKPKPPVAAGELWKTGEAYLVRRAAGEIAIDTKPHPEQWAHAMVIKDFKIPITLKPVRAETQARLLWDDQHLYAEFLARDKDLKAKYTKRDDPLWEEDVVEMFLKPSDKPPYYEFEVNPLGTVMALEIPDRAKKGTLAQMSKWETGIRSAVQVSGTIGDSKDRDDFYRVIMAIPWKNLKYVGGKPPAEGDQWKFTICRYDYVEGFTPEEQTSAPLTDQSFHHYEDYSTLKFVK